MSTYFGWLDYSEEDKKKMLDVISLLKERDTRDELGLGTVRDTFADIFFPGTSTIQTAAKYFLFVPWIYMKCEESNANAEKIAIKARRYELRLINCLLKGSEVNNRIIGNTAKERLQRLPSSIYWAGLFKWKLRLYDGSQDQYHKQIDYFYKQRKVTQVVDEDNFESGTEKAVYNWNTNLSKIKPPNFLKDGYMTNLKLNRRESEFLSEQLLRCQSGTLLAFLLDNGRISDVDFPWEHPTYHKFPQEIKRNIKHAELFSNIMHGASLLYNFILAVKMLDISNSNSISRSQELISNYEIEIGKWSILIKNNINSITKWNRTQFWEIVKENNPRLSRKTQDFINKWLEYVISNSQILNLTKDKNLIQLITDRERQLKPEKLCRIINRQALANWSGASGTQQIDYRWKQAQIIINDILEGLKHG